MLNIREITILCAALLLLFCQPAIAGMQGQPQPDTKTTESLRKAVADISGSGDLSRARPALLLALEKSPTADVTDILAPALTDSTVYFGALSTFEEALRSASSADSNYLRYNIGRTHLLRSRMVSLTRDKQGVLSAGSEAVAPFRELNMRDFAALDLAADIEMERGRTDDAIAIYRRIGTLPSSDVPGYSPKAYAAFKEAQGQQRAGRTDAARRQFDEAIRLDRAAGSPGYITHLSYLGIAEIYLRQGNTPAAAQALTQSSRVSQNPDQPYRFRLDVARTLLQRGYRREVSDFANKAVTHAPDDTAAKQLAADARGR